MRRWCIAVLVIWLEVSVQIMGSLEEPQHSIQKRFEEDKASPAFVSDNYQVLESDGTIEDLVCVEAGDDVRFISVFSARGLPEKCFRFPCPSATEGEDFVAVSKLEFFLEPEDEVCFNITLIDDDVIEGREFFLVALEDLRWGEIIDVVVITINDDDDPSLRRAIQTVSEGVGTASMCVDGGIESVPVVMHLQESSSASSQSPGLDFTIVDNGEVVIDPGEMSCFAFSIVDDDLDEKTEDIKVFFTEGNNTNATFTLEGTIRILDNDFSPRFENTLFTSREDDGFVEVCVTFKAAASTTVSAHVTTQDRTALDRTDYVYYESRFNISGGEKVCHDIQLLNDTTPERTELFQLTITSSNSEAPPQQALVRIYDDDVLDFDSPDRRYFIVEDFVQLPICVDLLSGSNNATVSGYIYTQARSAEANDFWALRQRFLLNHTSQRCFNVIILEDGRPEVEEEFRVYLLTISGGFTVKRVIATVVIRDDDATPCADLVPPTNGRILFLSNGNIPGSNAVYVCEEDFSLKGSRKRVCQVDGTWTGTTPTCEGS